MRQILKVTKTNNGFALASVLVLLVIATIVFASKLHRSNLDNQHSRLQKESEQIALQKEESLVRLNSMIVEAVDLTRSTEDPDSDRSYNHQSFAQGFSSEVIGGEYSIRCLQNCAIMVSGRPGPLPIIFETQVRVENDQEKSKRSLRQVIAVGSPRLFQFAELILSSNSPITVGAPREINGMAYYGFDVDLSSDPNQPYFILDNRDPNQMIHYTEEVIISGITQSNFGVTNPDNDSSLVAEKGVFEGTNPLSASDFLDPIDSLEQAEDAIHLKPAVPSLQAYLLYDPVQQTLVHGNEEDSEQLQLDAINCRATYLKNRKVKYELTASQKNMITHPELWPDGLTTKDCVSYEEALDGITAARAAEVTTNLGASNASLPICMHTLPSNFLGELTQETTSDSAELIDEQPVLVVNNRQPILLEDADQSSMITACGNASFIFDQDVQLSASIQARSEDESLAIAIKNGHLLVGPYTKSLVMGQRFEELQKTGIPYSEEETLRIDASIIAPKGALMIDESLMSRSIDEGDQLLGKLHRIGTNVEKTAYPYANVYSDGAQVGFASQIKTFELSSGQIPRLLSEITVESSLVAVTLFQSAEKEIPIARAIERLNTASAFHPFQPGENSYLNIIDEL